MFKVSTFFFLFLLHLFIFIVYVNPTFIKTNFFVSLLTGTAAASRVFNEALAKIAVNAQQGGTTDIGK